jgi:hypothetical protein
MGVWGIEPWDNDMASDWFVAFFRGIDVDKRIEEALQLGYNDEVYELRAACYILETLGRTYVWPGNIERQDQYLRTGIALLSEVNDPKTEWGKYFLDWWNNDSEMIASVKRQIEALTARLEQK